MRTPVLILDDGRYLTYQGDVKPAAEINAEQFSARKARNPEYTALDWQRENAPGDGATLAEQAASAVKIGQPDIAGQWFIAARKQGRELADLTSVPEGVEDAATPAPVVAAPVKMGTPARP